MHRGAGFRASVLLGTGFYTGWRGFGSEAHAEVLLLCCGLTGAPGYGLHGCCALSALLCVRLLVVVWAVWAALNGGLLATCAGACVRCG